MTRNRGPQRTKDGWVHVLPYSGSHYEALFRFGGRTDLVNDERTQTRRARIANADFLYAQLHELIALRTTDEWLEFCREADIPATRVESLDDLIDDLPDAEHPVAGRYKQIPPPVRFATSPQSVRSPAPLIGQDTDAILADLGISADEPAGEHADE